MAEPTPGAPPRIGGLDALRGAALCGMAAYHLAWDLNHLGWPVPDPAGSAAWTAFGDLVAGVFLFVSGIGLVLARPKGLGAALRRLATLVAAGLAVTGASLWFAPEAPILFGVLQCIAAADALALAALALPPAARLGLAALAASAPLGRSAAFDGWVGAALGLSVTPPPTLDLRPLLPWLAAVLLGTVTGEALARHRGMGRPGGRGARVLRWAGRHSLALYLLHQPALYGALLLLGLIVGKPVVETDPFALQCQADCAATGAAPRLCVAACACTAVRLAGEARHGGTTLTQRHSDAIGEACRHAGG